MLGKKSVSKVWSDLIKKFGKLIWNSILICDGKVLDSKVEGRAVIYYHPIYGRVCAFSSPLVVGPGFSNVDEPEYIAGDEVYVKG